MTTIPATARLLEGYVGPCDEEDSDAGWYRVVWDCCEHVMDGLSCPIRLNLSHPIAFSHVLRLVAEAVGLDARGGVVLRLYTNGSRGVIWAIECDGAMRYFTSVEPEAAVEQRIPNLPASPDAYPEALAAIAAVVLEDGR